MPFHISLSPKPLDFKLFAPVTACSFIIVYSSSFSLPFLPVMCWGT